MAQAQQPGYSLVRFATPAWLALIVAGSFAPSPRAFILADPATRDTSIGFRHPTGIAVDSTGAVYVAGSGDSTIAVFPPGATGSVVPVRRIGGPRTGLVSAQGIARDSRGTIHVTSGPRRIEEGGTIIAYPPNSTGNVAPVRVIQGARAAVRDPSAIAIGPRGEVYLVTAGGAAVLGFGADATGDVEPELRLVSPPRRVVLFHDDDDDDDNETPGAADVEVGEDGSPLVLSAEGVTTHGPAGPLSRKLLRASGDRKNLFRFLDRPRFARGPGGELYVAHSAPLGPGASRIDTMFPVFRPRAVFVFARGGSGDTVPVRTISGPLTDMRSVTDLAIGRDGSFYVLGGGSLGRVPRTESRIAIYPPNADGDVAPVRVIGGPATGLMNPTGLALDRDGRIYVTTSEVTENTFEVARLNVYAPDAEGDAAPIRTIAGPAARMSRPAGVAVTEDGAVYVVNSRVFSRDYGSVRAYAGDADGDAPPLRTLIGPETRFAGPAMLAVDRDTLYVVSPALRRVTVHPPGAGAAPVRVLQGDATELDDPSGLAFNHLGQLYVADREAASGINAYGPDLGAVRVHRAGATGNEAPLRTIKGSLTRLNGPGGLAVDRRGNVYVANRWGTGPGSVTVYGPRADGDMRPLRMIAGPATGLRAPAALTLDAHDTLYVVNAGTVTVYRPGADGNAAPVRTFWGP